MLLSLTASRASPSGSVIASSLMKLHDGTLSIVSEVGKGTAVTLTFPASRVRPAVPGAAVAA